MLSWARIAVGAHTIVSLMFEQFPVRTAVVITDAQGVVLSASDNVQELFLLPPPNQMAGFPLDRYIKTPSGGLGYLRQSMMAARLKLKSYEKNKRVKGLPLVLYYERARGERGDVTLQVIDDRNGQFVCTLQVGNVAETASRGAKEDEELGHYTIKGALGEGLCGVVRRGVHRATGVQVAIKTLDKARYDEIQLAWPTRDLCIMRYLSHPNIAMLYETINRGPDVVFLIMECAEGGELLELCSHGPLREEDARRFFRDILSAVDYLHRKGLVHRDLKVSYVSCLSEPIARWLCVVLLDSNAHTHIHSFIHSFIRSFIPFVHSFLMWLLLLERLLL